jgi:hypothetical protein
LPREEQAIYLADWDALTRPKKAQTREQKRAEFDRRIADLRAAAAKKR